MSTRRVPPPASLAIGPRALRWLHAWTGRNEYRPCRAIFRPADPSTLDPRLFPFIEKTVTVRLVRNDGGDSSSAGGRLYRIVSRGASRQLRPERDFDFLE